MEVVDEVRHLLAVGAVKNSRDHGLADGLGNNRLNNVAITCKCKISRS